MFAAVQTQEDFSKYKDEFYDEVVSFRDRYGQYLHGSEKDYFLLANKNILTAMLGSTSFYKADQFVLIFLRYKSTIIEIISKNQYTKQEVFLKEKVLRDLNQQD